MNFIYSIGILKKETKKINKAMSKLDQEKELQEYRFQLTKIHEIFKSIEILQKLHLENEYEKLH